MSSLVAKYVFLKLYNLVGFSKILNFWILKWNVNISKWCQTDVFTKWITLLRGPHPSMTFLIHVTFSIWVRGFLLDAMKAISSLSSDHTLASIIVHTGLSYFADQGLPHSNNTGDNTHQKSFPFKHQTFCLQLVRHSNI